MTLPRNHNKIWTPTEERKLINIVCAYTSCTDIAYFANEMGRTEDSITSRLAKMLRLQYYTSNEQLLKLFRKQFHYQESTMDDEDRTLKGPSKYLLVSLGYSSCPADTMEEAETTARALIQKNPTREVFIFQAVKRVYTPANVLMEDIA
jgi:hypothetical protein